MIKVTIIEDYANLRNRLVNLMKQSKKIECMSTYSSMEAFSRAAPFSEIPDIVLLDLGLPGISGIEGIPIIKKFLPNAEIVIFTTSNSPDLVFKAICAGATGYLLKDINFDYLEYNLIAIHEKGGSAISPQIARRIINYFQKGQVAKNSESIKLKDKEYIIVKALSDGLNYKDISDSLELSVDGVRYHIKNIYRKLQVNSKAQVIGKFMSGEIDME